MDDVTALRDALLDMQPYTRDSHEYAEFSTALDALIAAVEARAEQRFDEALAMHSEGPHHHYKVTDCIAALTPERLARAIHRECEAEWDRKATRDPLWQGTMHGADAHDEHAAAILAALATDEAVP